MRKNLSGKTEYCAHTRNAARGKRGTNKLERRVPVPDSDEPAFKKGKRKKKKAKTKYPFLIEWLVPLMRKNWVLYSSFERREDRDRELEKHLRKFSPGKAMGIRFRSVDLPLE